MGWEKPPDIFICGPNRFPTVTMEREKPVKLVNWPEIFSNQLADLAAAIVVEEVRHLIQWRETPEQENSLFAIWNEVMRTPTD